MRDPMASSRHLSDLLEKLTFQDPVAYVYNPLAYARAAHEMYLARYAKPGVPVVMLGMNPGPFGMTQTGVPFGEISMVRDWMGITTNIDKPAHEHPKRPIEGFACPRSEVSGKRLWGFAKNRFETPERFFKQFFVANYCPLVFMEEGGKNITPDKLPAHERASLEALCDEALRELIAYIKPEWVIGVGAFAEKRARLALGNMVPNIGRITHPSPASPAANRGWEPIIVRELEALGIAV